jgi:hypothetical protein
MGGGCNPVVGDAAPRAGLAEDAAEHSRIKYVDMHAAVLGLISVRMELININLQQHSRRKR